jgi:hypothetical protein
MAQRIYSRTIHTIQVDVQDDVLAKIEAGDEVEVVLMGRNGIPTSAKKLSPRDIDQLLDNDGMIRPKRSSKDVAWK